jgi:hypothetical protein
MIRPVDRPAASRADSRKSWPVRKYRLGEEPSDDLSDSTTPEERLEMMWPLALEAWTLAGKPLPDYERSAAPVLRVLRRP